MTTNIYTIQEEKHLIKELKELINKYTRINQIIQRKENKHLLDFINFKTPKLQNPVYNNITKIYWILNDLTDFPKCANPNCDNLVGVGQNVKLSKTHGYKKCCSIKCGALSPDRNKKLSNTTKQKYGVSWPSKLDRVKNKMKQTNLKKYGTICPLQNEAIQNKSQQTNLEKFGVSIANQFNSTDEIRQKYEENCLEIYGAEHPWKNEEVLEKRRNTWIKKYGVDNPTKNTAILDKIKETNLTNFNVENVFQADEVKEKIKETNLERYGVEYASQNDDVKSKMRQTNIERYGTPHYAQSKEFGERQIYSRFKYNNIYFDSKAELAFYKKCLENNINIKRSIILYV